MTAAAASSREREVVGAPEPREYFSVRAPAKRSLLWLVTAWIPQSWLTALIHLTCPVTRWLWARWWSRLLIRLIAGWHAAGALLMIVATPALADPAGGGGASPFFAWMNLKDSHGIDAWGYFLSIDKGNASVGGGWRMIWAYIITLEYEVFRFLMATAIWFITWVLSFEWLELILTPVRTIADSVTSITDQFALTPLMLTVAGFSVAIWIIRGRFSTGIYELLMSCVIAAAAVGVLSNPVDRVLGDDGLVLSAREAGLEVASGLANGGDPNGNPQTEIETIESKLIDTFIRQPTQLINFGVVLDAPENNGKCVKEFDAAYLAKPKEPGLADKAQDVVSEIAPGAGVALDLINSDAKPEDRVKDAIAKCEGKAGPMKAYADNPGPGQAMGLFFLIFAGALLMAFAIYLAGRLIIAAGVSIGNAIKSIPGVVLAIAPSMRGQFWRTIANVAMALLQMIFAIVFLVGYVMVVEDLFAADESNLIRTVFFVDIFLVTALLLFRRAVKGMKRLSDNLATILAKRPNAAPTAISRSTPTTARDIAAMAANGRHLYQGGKAVVKGAGALAKKSGTAAATTGKVAAGATSTAATGGAAAVLVAGRVLSSTAKRAKNKVDSIADPGSYPKSTSGTVDARTSRGTAATNAAADAVRSRLSKTAVSDKAGIKHPIGVAPSLPVANPGQVRASATTTSSPDGRRFREFTTTSGAPVMLPTTPSRTPRPARPASAETGIPNGSSSKTAQLLAAAAQSGSAPVVKPSALAHRAR